MQAEVLAILRRRGTPMSADAVLGQLRDSNPQLAPPTICRALAALTERGGVHRLESLNAVITCKSDSHKDASILSICDDCGEVEEFVSPDLLKARSSIAGQPGFAPTRHVIEVLGQCASCGSAQDQA